MSLAYPKRRATLNFLNVFEFSIHSNERHKMRYFLANQEHKLDFNIHSYQLEIQAYLEKRWTKKHEIEPKIYIIKPLKSIEDALKTQKLMNFTTLFDNARLLNLSKTAEIDSKYIMSICCEQHYKGMIDQYLEKVLVNGSVVPLQEFKEYEKIKAKVLALYRKFFYGDHITIFERNIEKRYLATKQKKWGRFLANPKLTMNKCVWTFNEQRCLEGFRNWRTRSLGLFDDFRPLFDNFPEAREVLVKQYGFLDSFFGKQKTDLTYPASVMLSRTIAYCQSTEFIKNLIIPPDFHIEMSIINFHLSILIAKLRKNNDTVSKLISHHLETHFETYLQDKYVKLRISENNLSVFQTVKYFKKLRNFAIDYHVSLLTEKTPRNFKNLEKIIQKVVFLNKRGIRSDKIKLFAFYTCANLDYFNSLDLYEMITKLEWDTYRISFDIFTQKEMTTEKNPSLEKKLEELDDLSYLEEWNWHWIYNRLFKLMRKFSTLSAYDYFSEREEADKTKKKKNQKYFWKNQEKEEFLKD